MYAEEPDEKFSSTNLLKKVLLIVQLLLLLLRLPPDPVRRLHRFPVVVDLQDPGGLQPPPEVLQRARLLPPPAGLVAGGGGQRRELRLLVRGGAEEPPRDRRPGPAVLGEQLDARGADGGLGCYSRHLHVIAAAAEMDAKWCSIPLASERRDGLTQCAPGRYLAEFADKFANGAGPTLTARGRLPRFFY